MNAMEVWLAFSRGPLFWAALTSMVVGLARHVVIATIDLARAIQSAGDNVIPYRQVLRATLRWALPVSSIADRLLFSLTSLVFHISVILVPLFLAGHIELWQRGLGLAWPALANSVATALAVAAVVTAVSLVIQRSAARDSRAISRFQDYALPLVVALPFASGLAVMHPTLSPLSHDAALLVHVLSGDMLLLLIPITKLNHMALLPGTQLVSEVAWHFPSDSGDKVAQALGKVNEPI